MIAIKPKTPRDARTVTNRILKLADLRASSTSRRIGEALITEVWTVTSERAELFAGHVRGMFPRADVTVTNGAVTVTWA